jgi:hypothetical protein
MIDYLMRYYNNTRKISAMFPEDGKRLDELARRAHERIPETLDELELEREDTAMLADAATHDIIIYGGFYFRPRAGIVK